jgi:hypothetical protein
MAVSPAHRSITVAAQKRSCDCSVAFYKIGSKTSSVVMAIASRNDL